MNNIFIVQKYRLHPPFSSHPWKEVAEFKKKFSFIQKTDLPHFPKKHSSCDCIQITQKFSYSFSCCERVARILLGITLTIVTLGIILIFKSARKLFYKDHLSIKIVQPVYLDQSTSTISFPKKRTFETNFSDIDINRVQQVVVENIKDIETKKSSSNNVHFFTSSNHVFSLTAFPGWIFKTNFSQPNRITDRFEYTKTIRTAVKNNRFDRIVIPESHLIRIKLKNKIIPIIVEKRLNIPHEADKQEQMYLKHKNEYQLALQQFTHLICKENLTDINWENCPLLFDDTSQTFSRIALFDLEPLKERDDAGLFGDDIFERRGLINCVPPEYFPKIWTIIKNYGKKRSSYKTAVRKRLTELQRNYALNEFYKNNHIIFGNETLSADPESLLQDIDLDLNETCDDITMKDAFLKTVKYINQKLKAIPKNPSSVRKARIIRLVTGRNCLGFYHCNHFSPNMYHNRRIEKPEDSWLSLIIESLIKKRIIFDIVRRSSHIFKIQA